tara:strand:+ start:2052 stop:2384 length:333 start_codon:yes stop_codon:yes gene_type:complete
MNGLITSYAHRILKIYSSFISIPKEIDGLNKPQKIWLILACPYTFIAWSMALIVPVALWIEDTYSFSGEEDILFLIAVSHFFFLAGGFLLPPILYWITAGLYSIWIWVSE